MWTGPRGTLLPLVVVTLGARPPPPRAPADTCAGEGGGGAWTLGDPAGTQRASPGTVLLHYQNAHTPRRQGFGKDGSLE